MKTWAKQLEEALPNAAPDVLDSIMDEHCPYYVLGGEFAPKYLGWEPLDEGCEECWDSCESKCRYERRKE